LVLVVVPRPDVGRARLLLATRRIFALSPAFTRAPMSVRIS
jgi:hypothetical protein